MSVEEQILQAGQSAFMHHAANIHYLFATLLTGNGIAHCHSEQFQDNGLAYSSPDLLVLEKPVQIIQIILMSDLPPFLA